MRAVILAGLLCAAAAPITRGQAKDTAIDLADVTTKPSMISRPDLGYKDCYKDAGLTGTDVVKFVIDTSGHVDLQSVGLTEVTDPILDTLAVRLVRGMVFKPGSMAGANVRVSVGLPVHFGGGGAPAAPEARVFEENCVDRKAQLTTNLGSEAVVVGQVQADSYAVTPGMAATPGKTVRLTPRGAMRVQVRVEVNAVGQVTDAAPKDASVPTEVAQRAVAAARRMRFLPARIDGNPVASWITIPITAAM